MFIYIPIFFYDSHHSLMVALIILFFYSYELKAKNFQVLNILLSLNQWFAKFLSMKKIYIFLYNIADEFEASCFIYYY